MPLLKCLPDTPFRVKLEELLEEAMMNHQFYIDRIRLFNPTLEYWLTRDDIQIVKTDLGLLPLAQNIVVAISRRIDKGDFGMLVDIADAPPILAEAGKRLYWDRVRRQSQILMRFLSSNHPIWAEPALESHMCLLSLIHSRLLMPANWLFPIWQEDYAISVLQSNAADYDLVFGSTGASWTNCMHTLLARRESLWRQQLCYGSHCAEGILQQI